MVPGPILSAKIGLPGLILAAKIVPPLAKNSPPTDTRSDARPYVIWLARFTFRSKTAPHVKMIIYILIAIFCGPLFHGTDRTGPNPHTILRNGPDHR